MLRPGFGLFAPGFDSPAERVNRDKTKEYQLRVNKAEYRWIRMLMSEDRSKKAFFEPKESEVFKSTVKALSKDLSLKLETNKAIGLRSIVHIVVVEPGWLITSGELKRWTDDPLPEDELKKHVGMI